ncbi:PE-PGRS family protein PE_PGRS16 isoform X2 [Scophthalmus maximus]|uniref:PE-PGRS family protein PE_PGRS16 isoform X2 n=1 Tax=Scophthalmus maximus TaxID=52904 RepID=UPI001FA8B9CD|nr:PE-PGRS family protein PE_PGRS16 isoform X2 [Scophthalmus maximus]
MLPPNLLIVSMIVFLVTTVSTAPVEEKEHEEAEVETTEEGEGELSEEEDDDDSKSQDKSEGILGVQQTAVASASGGSVSSVQSAGGGRDAAAGSDAGPPSSPGSPGSAGSPGSPGSAGSVAAELPGSSSGQTQTAGSDGVDSHGNAQKLLNGGGGGGADSQTGVFPIFGGGFSHLDYTGIIDTSSHDFLLGLMGTSSGVSADQNTGSSLDLPAGHVHHQTDIGVDQSGGDHSSPSSGPDQSLPGSASGSSHSTTQQEAAAASSSSSVGDAHREQTGNGRQTHLTDETGVTDRPVPLSDLQTDLTDLVTVATDFTVTDTVSADPTGSPAETSHPAVTDHTQAAGSVTEQYNPSGQGPEGAENVELEDSC